MYPFFFCVLSALLLWVFNRFSTQIEPTVFKGQRTKKGPIVIGKLERSGLYPIGSMGLVYLPIHEWLIFMVNVGMKRLDKKYVRTVTCEFWTPWP